MEEEELGVRGVADLRDLEAVNASPHAGWSLGRHETKTEWGSTSSTKTQTNSSQFFWIIFDVFGDHRASLFMFVLKCHQDFSLRALSQQKMVKSGRCSHSILHTLKGERRMMRANEFKRRIRTLNSDNLLDFGDIVWSAFRIDSSMNHRWKILEVPKITAASLSTWLSTSKKGYDAGFVGALKWRYLLNKEAK